jgi:hypothetical protein
VYVILNERLRKAYVGITRQRLNARLKQHKKLGNTASSKRIAQLKDTEFHQLTDYVFDVENVGDAERYWVDDYRKKGYFLLNDDRYLGRTGTSNRLYSDEVIYAEAKKYSRRVDFKMGSPKIYDAAVSQRILNSACSHMRRIEKRGHWTKESCVEFAKSCSDRDEFNRASNGAYAAACKNDWLDDIHKILRSRLDMGWLKARGDRVKLWSMADHYYDLWIANDRCGYWRMRTLTGVNLQKMLRKFESGWVPSKDSDWERWSHEQKLEVI